MRFLLHWCFAFGVLSATYNPTRWNFSIWALQNWPDQTAKVLSIGALLLGLYLLYLFFIVKGLGWFGLLIVTFPTLIFVAVVGWALMYWNIFDVSLSDSVAWASIGVIAFIMASAQAIFIERVEIQSQVYKRISRR